MPVDFSEKPANILIRNSYEKKCINSCVSRFFCCLAVQGLKAQPTSGISDLRTLQQQFVDLKFGMFIHFNIPTFMSDDWADPDAVRLFLIR